MERKSSHWLLFVFAFYKKGPGVSKDLILNIYAFSTTVLPVPDN
jgi:hypothetical protein